MLCGWPTASLSRSELAGVVRASAAHGNAVARIESCQRVEVYHRTPCECDAPFHARGLDALGHLAEVAAGLHSVVLGEAQVLGQVRAAIAAAPDDLQRLLTPAVSAARALRAETTFGAHTGHLLDRALRIAGIETAGRVGVIGVGSAGRLVAERAAALGASEVVVFGRRHPEGHWFEEGGFRFERLNNLARAGEFDVLAACLGSGADELDGSRDLPIVRQLIVDLGTPKNIGGECRARYISIADMLEDEERWRHTAARRSSLAARLRELLEERLRMEAEDSETPVGRLRLEVERIRRAEIERTGRLHPEIAADVVDQITRSLVNQIFHLPSQRLKRMEGDELGRRLVELFAREEREEEPTR